MDKTKKSSSKDHIEFPHDIKNYTKEECAIILRKALTRSEEFKYQSEIAKVTGINEKSIGDYFTARYKVPQKRWSLLREVLYKGKKRKAVPENKIKEKQLKEAMHSAKKLKALAFLIKDELNFFKNSSSDARKILKEYLSGSEAGYFASLLTALYDEDQLDIWKTFSK